jgi:hypothetical protein
MFFLRPRHAQCDIGFALENAQVSGVGDELQLQSRVRAQQFRHVWNQQVPQHDRHGGQAHLPLNKLVETLRRAARGVYLGLDV